MILGVFCGGAAGNAPLYADAARDLGRTLAQGGIEIVYGGGREGLMGALADGALAEGGRIIGVMPRAFVEHGCTHKGLSRLEVVETTQERKALVAQLADGFVTLPGGPGTFEEMFEQWTAGQLGLHRKPCGFLNVAGFFEPLKALAYTAIDAGFLRQEYADMLVFEDRPDELVRRFGDYVPPPPKWSQASGGGAEAPGAQPLIRIAAALILDRHGRTLLVRKAGSEFFMQPGGKIEPHETPVQALSRELEEELSLRLSDPGTYLGRFQAPAANEPGFLVDAEVFRLVIDQTPRIAGEIADARWMTFQEARHAKLAPLTRILLTSA